MPRSPSGASARRSPRVLIKSLERNALHTSQIRDMVRLNGNRSNVGTQGLDIVARRLEAVRRRRDPHQFLAGLKHRVAAGADITADGIEHHVADRTDGGEILAVVVDHTVGTEAA